MYNPLVTRTPNRLFEICDLEWYSTRVGALGLG